MSTIKIPNVPSAVHRRLKDLAAEAGMSLSNYLIAELVARVGLAELRDELHRADGADIDETELIRKKH